MQTSLHAALSSCRLDTNVQPMATSSAIGLVPPKIGRLRSHIYTAHVSTTIRLVDIFPYWILPNVRLNRTKEWIVTSCYGSAIFKAYWILPKWSNWLPVFSNRAIVEPGRRSNAFNTIVEPSEIRLKYDWKQFRLPPDYIWVGPHMVIIATIIIHQKKNRKLAGSFCFLEGFIEPHPFVLSGCLLNDYS